ncbi:MAG: serine protease [Barrevirus sp.]|uniref:Serine protease n=1 Tax=Barrevirus sp. TaxID=2487763 RepID=A0A3G4ZPJ0_9VIRU|nr:MAG: serine protease [Barrevirus sp.]
MGCHCKNRSNCVNCSKTKRVDNLQVDCDLEVKGNTILDKDLFVLGNETVNKNLTVAGTTNLLGSTKLQDVEVFGTLTVDRPIRLLPQGERVITVGTPGFPTIQSAIDTFRGFNAGTTTIVIPPNIYEEYVVLEGFSSAINEQVRDPNQNDFLLENVLRGLQIIGDNRVFIPGKAYINGYENASSSTRGVRYQITTTDPTSGPYDAFIAASFGTIGGIGPSGIQIAKPLVADKPLTNVFLPNQIALIERGTVGFATKALNAQNGGGVGAVAAIIYNNNPTGGIIFMGGTNNLVTIPAYSVSFDTGVTLQALITANPGIQITISPVDPIYDPPLGTNYAFSQIVINDTRDQLTINMVGPLPDYDDNIVAIPTVLVNPDFNNEKISLVPGDRIAISDSNLLGNLGKSLHTIVSVNGNTITIDPPVLPVIDGGVDFSVIGSSVTFLPNVCISPPFIQDRPLTAAFRSNGVSFSMNGIWVDQNAGQPFANILQAFLFVDGSVLVNNIVATDFFSTSFDPAIEMVNGYATIEDGFRATVNGHWSVIGWGQGIGIITNSSLGFGNVFVTNILEGAGIEASLGSQIGIDNLQIMGCQGLFQPDNGAGILLGGGELFADATLNVNKLLHVADVWGPGIALFRDSTCLASNPSVRVERCINPANGTNSTGAGINVSCGSQMIISKGTFYSTGGLASQPRLVSIIRDMTNPFSPDTLPNVGILVEEGGAFRTGGGLLFIDNDLNTQTLQDAIFSAPYNEVVPATTNNVLQILASGPLDSTFLLQEFIGLASNMTLDPSAIYNLDKLYWGKTFTVFSGNSGTNTITLTSPATFIGMASGVTATFNGLGSSITFRILNDTQVLILSLNNVIIS